MKLSTTHDRRVRNTLELSQYDLQVWATKSLREHRQMWPDAPDGADELIGYEWDVDGNGNIVLRVVRDFIYEQQPQKGSDDVA